MATYQNQRFESQEIAVDGNQYENCAFDSCILIFEGGDVPIFNGCTFRNIKIQLRGAAAQTTSYLGVLNSSGLPNEVETVLSNVQSGIPLMPDRPAPPPLLNTGSNVRGLLIGTGIFAVFVGWLFFLYLYSWILQPMAQLESGEPLEVEIAFDLIPVLPDTLAEAYDILRDNQLEQLTTTEIVDGENNVARIPIESAFSVMIANGDFPLGDDPVTGIINDDDLSNAAEDSLSTEANDGSVGPVGADTDSADADSDATAEDADEAIEEPAVDDAEATQEAADETDEATEEPAVDDAEATQEAADETNEATEEASGD